MPGAFKLDHLQPFKPLLFWKISNSFTFILGSQFLLPQRANNGSWENFPFLIWMNKIGLKGCKWSSFSTQELDSRNLGDSLFGHARVTWCVDEDDVIPQKRAAMSRPQEPDAGVRAEAVGAECVGDRPDAVAGERDRSARRRLFLLLFGGNHDQFGLHLARAFHLDEATKFLFCLS